MIKPRRLAAPGICQSVELKRALFKAAEGLGRATSIDLELGDASFDASSAHRMSQADTIDVFADHLHCPVTEQSLGSAGMIAGHRSAAEVAPVDAIAPVDLIVLGVVDAPHLHVLVGVIGSSRGKCGVHDNAGVALAESRIFRPVATAL